MDIGGIRLNNYTLGINDAGGITVDGNTVISNWIDPIDVLTSDSVTAPLAANQGRVLKEFIDILNAVVASDDLALDTLQEVVTYIKANKAKLDSLQIHHIAGLQAELDSKLEDAELLQLGIGEFTAFRGDLGLISYNHSQIAHAPSDAEANVQSDWNQVDTGHDGFIQNKPTQINGGSY